MFEWFVNINRKYSSFNVYGFGQEQCTEKFSNKLKQYQGLKLCFVISGSGIFRFDELKYDLKKGIAILIKGDMDFSYTPNVDNEPSVIIWIAFDGELFNRILDNHVEPLVYINDSIDGIELLFCELRMCKFTGDDNEELLFLSVLSNTMYLMLSGSYIDRIAQTSIDFSKNDKNAETNLIKKSLEYIKSNYMNDLHVHDISAYLHIDRSYFSRIFIKKLGMTPSNYMLQYKLNNAIELLLNSDFSNEKIAEMSGFESSQQFCDSFKKVNGVSPISYKQSKKQ